MNDNVNDNDSDSDNDDDNVNDDDDDGDNDNDNDNVNDDDRKSPLAWEREGLRWGQEVTSSEDCGWPDGRGLWSLIASLLVSQIASGLILDIM